MTAPATTAPTPRLNGSSLSSWPESGPAAAAAQALGLALRGAPEAAAAAATAMARARSEADVAGMSMAEHALGLVARVRDDASASTAHLRRAIAQAEAGGLAEIAGEARVSLTATLANDGDFAGALEVAGLAATALRGTDLARLRTQRATVLQHLGRLDDALDEYRRALPVLRRAGDQFGLAQLHNNRAVLHSLRDDQVAEETDLHRAEALMADLGMETAVINVRQNLANLAARRGDVPTALALYDHADAFFAERGQVDALGLLDRCESLLAAGLVDEARSIAERAVRVLEHAGRKGYLAEARLMVAEAALLEGDTAAARQAAAEARREFSRQLRPTWAVLARYFGLRARWLEGDRSSTILTAAHQIGDSLASAGFEVAAVDARLLAAQVALHRGRLDLARRELALVAPARRRGPAGVRSQAWYAEALLRLADGDRRGAYSALRAGMAVLDRYRATLGATELRAYASTHGVELGRLGIHLACQDGDAERVLAWAERWRAGTLRLRPVRPPEDARLAADLAALRAVVADQRQAVMAGHPTRLLRARQAELENAVRVRARHAVGIHDGAHGAPPSARELTRQLGSATLVEIVDDDGFLHAVVLSAGRSALRRLCPAADAHAELDHLRASLRQLAFRHGSTASLAAAEAAAVHHAGRLDTLLFGPVVEDLRPGPLVVVPTGPLHVVPWSVLPSCAGRPVTVSPSASLWSGSRAAADDAPPGPTVLVAGPGLAHAAAEVRALGRAYRGATSLTGRRATCAAVCAAMDGAALAHVAGHGRYRADNPLLSALELADGPLTVYDLECLDRAPRVVVLSACDSGVSEVRPGDELMGLAAAVLALGTRALVAATLPVPDEATRRLMLALHAGLRAGLPPAAALVRAQTKVATGGIQAGAGFVCIGAGHRGISERPGPIIHR